MSPLTIYTSAGVPKLPTGPQGPAGAAGAPGAPGAQGPAGPAGPQGTPAPSVPRVTSLPAGAKDGDEVFFVADAPNGVLWRLRFNASGTTYRWEYVGGPALLRLVSTIEATNSQTYTDLSTVGPEVQLPLAGVWDIVVGCTIQNAGANNANLMAAKLGVAAAGDLEAAVASVAKINQPIYTTRTMRRTMGSPGAIRAQYRVDGGSGQFSDRVLRVTPVMVG